jgi:uncharacterized membrane protein YeiH
MSSGSRRASHFAISVCDALVGGGVLRSLLLRRTPRVFRPGELTALAAFGGTLVYAALAVGLRVNENAAGLVAIAVVTVTNWTSRRYRLQARAAWSSEARRRRRDSRAARAPRPAAPVARDGKAD